MSVIVTENWTGYSYQPLKKGTRVWVVTGVGDALAAWLAVGPQAYVLATFINPLTGMEDQYLLAGYPNVSMKGPAAFEVKQDYAYCNNKPKDPNPLAQPPRFQWQTANESGATDVSADALPLLNSAGATFESNPTGDFPYRILTATRFEPTYNLTIANGYEARTNSDSVALPNAGSMDKGQVLCKTYEPLTDYDVNTPYVKMRYTFWVRNGNKQDSDGVWDSWKHRILDQSYEGWYNGDSGPAQGAFSYVDTLKKVESPVLLDGTGMPINASNYTILDSSGTQNDPISNPNVFSGQLLEKTANAVFLKYLKFNGAPFAALGLF